MRYATVSPKMKSMAAHLGAIDELIADGICRKVGERLVFDHDLLGDWGRQRVLLSQPNIATFITSHNRGTSPLWLRSVRLWALDLLERQGDYAEMDRRRSRIIACREMAAADRVLEAAALSSNAGEAFRGDLVRAEQRRKASAVDCSSVS